MASNVIDSPHFLKLFINSLYGVAFKIAKSLLHSFSIFSGFSQINCCFRLCLRNNYYSIQIITWEYIIAKKCPDISINLSINDSLFISIYLSIYLFISICLWTFLLMLFLINLSHSVLHFMQQFISIIHFVFFFLIFPITALIDIINLNHIPTAFCLLFTKTDFYISQVRPDQ